MSSIPIEVLWTVIGVSILLPILGYLYRTQFPMSTMFFIVGASWLLIFLTTDTILLESFGTLDDHVLEVWNEQTITGQLTIHNGTGNVVIRGEHVTASNSQLFGHTVNCMEIAIGKTGSPSITTPVVLGVFNGDVSSSIAVTKYEFGRLNVTILNVDKEFFELCNNDSDYTIVTGDRIGVMYRGGDATNFVTINGNTQNPFDGTISVEADFNDATNVWTNINSNDLTQIILSLQSQDATPVVAIYDLRNETTLEPTMVGMMFIVFSLAMMLIGALIEVKWN